MTKTARTTSVGPPERRSLDESDLNRVDVAVARPGRLPRITLLLACCAAALPAQHEPDQELTAFRAAFARLQSKSPVLAIAVVGDGAPAVLCAGVDGAGTDVTPATLFPLGPLVRLLLADALAVEQPRRLDAAAGITFAGTALTVQDLVSGVAGLPDYFSFDGSAPIEGPTLLRCGEVLIAAGEAPSFRPSGAAELVLLERFLFGERERDWAGLLRINLAPHISGLAPVSANALDERAAASLTAPAALVRQAQPSALRLLAPGKELAEWWQWRLREQRFTTGVRIGNLMTDMGRPGVECWSLQEWQGPLAFSAIVWREQRAGMLLLGLEHGAAEPLTAAFDEDVLGPRPAGAGAGGFLGARAGKQKPPLQSLLGTWANAPDTPPCTLTVSTGAVDSLRITWGSREARSKSAQVSGKVVRVGLGEVDGVGGVLVLVPGADAAARRCTAVLLESHRSLAALPHCFELVRRGD